jgi:hypothetical protein
VDLALGESGDENVEGLLGDPVHLLEVEELALAHRGEQRPLDEGLGAVADLEHGRGVVVADHPRRGELGVALDEDDAEPGLLGDDPEQGRLAGARRPLEEHVTAGGERHREHLGLAAQADDVGGDPLEEMGRGERGRRTLPPRPPVRHDPAWTSTPRMFFPSSRSW